MKKLVMILLTASLLCGCGAANDTSPSASSTQPEESVADEPIAETEKEYTRYSSSEEFIASGLLDNISSSGYVPYTLGTDSGDYTLKAIEASGNYYMYTLTHNPDGKVFVYEFTYGDENTSPEKAGENAPIDKAYSETASSGGKDYGVYLFSTTLRQDSYTLSCVPEKGCLAVLSCTGTASDRELIGCFSELSLIPYSK